MPISTNTLFHFTKDVDTLKSILSFNFYPRLCLENLSDIHGDEMYLAFPMVCFCDIPLSQINNHVENYGNYALGLTKTWGINNGLSPILYIHNNSTTTSVIQSLHKFFLNAKNKEIEFKEMTIDYFHILPFIKSYETIKNKKIIRYYDEREWRYVPDMAVLLAHNITDGFFISKNEFNDPKYRDSINDKLKSCPLIFTPDDIKYVIVNDESQRINIYDHIIQTKRRNFSYESLQRLTTKILTIDQIKEDF